MIKPLVFHNSRQGDDEREFEKRRAHHRSAGEESNCQSLTTGRPAWRRGSTHVCATNAEVTRYRQGNRSNAALVMEVGPPLRAALNPPTPDRPFGPMGETQVQTAGPTSRAGVRRSRDRFRERPPLDQPDHPDPRALRALSQAVGTATLSAASGPPIAADLVGPLAVAWFARASPSGRRGDRPVLLCDCRPMLRARALRARGKTNRLTACNGTGRRRDRFQDSLAS
jgi:hypothetical protein